jgi:hypothetical protein
MERTATGARSIRVVSGIAAAAWLASWFLPVAAEVPGWLAFRYALEPVWNGEQKQWADAVPWVLSALTNVVFPVLFVLAYRGAITHPGVYIRVAIACFILNLYWIVQLIRENKAHELMIGYYAWLAAFALLLVSGVLVHRTSRRPTAGKPA